MKVLIILAFPLMVIGQDSGAIGNCGRSCTNTKKYFCSSENPGGTISADKYDNQCLCLEAKCNKTSVQCYTRVAEPATCSKICKSDDPTGINFVTPLCGSNGVTYDNMAAFKVAKCLNNTVEIVASGKCDSDRVKECLVGVLKQCLANKTHDSTPACGAHESSPPLKILYPNECYLNASMCMTAKDYLPVTRCNTPRNLLTMAGSGSDLFASEEAFWNTSYTGSPSLGDFYIGSDPQEIANSTSPNATIQPNTNSSEKIAWTISVGIVFILLFALGN